MKVSVAALCDFAQVREGLLFVSSGNITAVERPTFPAPAGVLLALSFVIEPDDRGRRWQLSLELLEQDGDTTSGMETEIGFDQQADPSEGLASHPHPDPSVTSLVVDMRPLPIPRPGLYRVAVKLDGEPVVELPLRATPP